MRSGRFNKHWRTRDTRGKIVRAMRKLFRVLVPSLVTSVFLSVTALSQVAWRQYSYPEDNFVLSSPSQPALAKQTTQTALGPMENRTYLVQLGTNIGFMISASDFKQGKPVSVKAVLESAKKGAADNSKSTISKERDVIVDGNTGVEFVLENQAFHSLVRCFFVDGKLLTIMAIAPADKAIPPEADRLFAGFHLVKKPA